MALHGFEEDGNNRGTGGAAGGYEEGGASDLRESIRVSAAAEEEARSLRIPGCIVERGSVPRVLRFEEAAWGVAKGS